MNPTKNIQQVLRDLMESPMFNLSLSSKELFHSNFLAWLGNNSDTDIKRLFIEVINQLMKEPILQAKDEWTVEREDKHFDLCIREKGKKGKKGKYILVIENKVKSIPIKKQLDDYGKKNVNGKGNSPKYLLLTLTEKFAHRTKIDKKHDPSNKWIVKTYKDLAEIMGRLQVSNCYIQSLLDDYIKFIENLDTLVRGWQSERCFAQDWNEIPKLKDIHAKIQFSRYCEKLKKEKLSQLSDIEIYDDNDIPEKPDPSKIYVKVYWEYASLGQDGILEVEIPVTSLDDPHIISGLKTGSNGPKVEYVIKIQVQGRSYRHVLETNPNFQNSQVQVGQALINLGRNRLYTDPSKLNYFSEDPLNEKLPLPNFGKINIFEKNPQLYPVNKGDGKNQIPEKRWPFASYKEKEKLNFIYQSRKIYEMISIDSVLDNIVYEVERIINSLPKVSIP